MLGVLAAAEGVEASIPTRLACRCETELELLCRVELLRLCAGWLGPVSVGSEGSRIEGCGFVELEDILVVLATEEEWARRADSSRVRRFTCVYCMISSYTG
jgi:hypothetical protein